MLNRPIANYHQYCFGVEAPEKREAPRHVLRVLGNDNNNTTTNNYNNTSNY